MSSAFPTPAAVAPRPSLSDRANALSATIDTLAQSIKVLAERLEPVLTPPDVMPEDPGGLADRPTDSWLNDFLNRSTRDIDGLTAAVSHLTRRVDL